MLKGKAMIYRNNTRSLSSRTRCGIAPLEFVMALPLLFLLFICVTWLGFSVIGQTEVLVEARNKAWKRRFEDVSKNPLHFPILPTYDQDSDYVTEKATKRIRISPIFDRVPGPEASHTILAGSWDYASMPFDKPPDLELIATAATIGTFGDAINWAAVLSDPIGAIKKLGGGIKNQTDSEKSGVGKGESSSGSSGGTGTAGGAGPDSKTPEQAKQDSEKDLEAEKAKLLKRYKELGGVVPLFNDQVQPRSGELEKAIDDVVRLQLESQQKSQAAINTVGDEEKKKAQEEAARAFRKLELARIKYKRLEAECLSVVKELEALGVHRGSLQFL